jgi:transcription initiation factor TFIID subunit 1
MKEPRIRIQDVLAAFPGNSDAAVRKRLKHCALFQRGGDDSGWWTLKDQSQLPNEDDLRSMVTPEMVCLYESMLAGQHRLTKLGITNFATYNTALQRLEEQEPNLK